MKNKKPDLDTLKEITKSVKMLEQEQDELSRQSMNQLANMEYEREKYRQAMMKHQPFMPKTAWKDLIKQQPPKSVLFPIAFEKEKIETKEKKTKRRALRLTDARICALYFIKENPGMKVGQVVTGAGCTRSDVYALQKHLLITKKSKYGDTLFKLLKKGEKLLADNPRPDIIPGKVDYMDSPKALAVIYKMGTAKPLAVSDLDTLNQLLSSKTISVAIPQEIMDAIENLRFAKVAAKLELEI